MGLGRLSLLGGLALAGCGDAPEADAGAGTCAATSLAAGETAAHTIEFDSGGGFEPSRSYLLRVPAGYDGRSPLPLVLQFHGYLSTAGQHEQYSDMSGLADAEQFAVAYPQGIENSWNAGACCATAAREGVDDVGFVRAVVADVQSKLCIDSSRIYASGMSNGGFLSHRLGCEAADLVAAIAPVDGVLGIPAESCQPSRPISVMHFHGTADLIVPYAGNPARNYVSVSETSAGWAERNGCGQAELSFEQGTARCESHRGCSAGTEVTLCTLTGMAHCWPGQPTCENGQDLSASAAMWEFFKRYSR